MSISVVSIPANPIRSSSARRAVLGIATVVALGLGTAASSEMYRYRDADGRMYVVDSLHKVPPAYRGQLDGEGSAPPARGVVNTGVPTWDAATAGQAHRARSKAVAAGPRISVFVTSWCGYCRKLERFLDERQIRYQRYDVDDDASARQRWKALAPGGGVPVTEVGSEVIRGYRPKALLAAIGR
jgi:glutaredoxin